MAESPQTTLTAILADMAASGDPERAAGAKAYMKSDLSFYGLQKAGVDAYATQFHKAHKKLPVDGVIGVVDGLLASDNFDEISLGVVIARLYWRRFDVAHLDSAWRPWFDGCTSWAHCDELATRGAGLIVQREPDASLPIIFRWRESDHLWTRRASMLCHLPLVRAKTVRIDVLLETFDALAGEDAFFIQKAMGWTLRSLGDYGYTEDAIRFMVANRDRLSRLALREGSRKLSEADQARVMET